MKSLLVKKHDADEEFDEALELSTDDDVVIDKPQSTIISTLMTKPGAYIITSFLIFLILFVTIENFEDSKKRKKVKKH